MANVGYTLMTEQAGPKDLVRWAARAEDAGFDLLVSSDHYFPWLDEQGHAPNAWVTLGAVAQATGRAELMTAQTTITCTVAPTPALT
jgi:alkanesulfonate monooxygenase SsuD/methylene tetrahydromethanopterin reductase-like flavin-dependent oxidoreductase (luciferase family)